MDAADIMGLGGRGGSAPAPRKGKDAAAAKPKGVSREVRALKWRGFGARFRVQR